MCRRYAGPFMLVRPGQRGQHQQAVALSKFSPVRVFALLGVGVSVAL